MAATRAELTEKALEVLQHCSSRFDGCLLYNGPIDEQGYGYTNIGRQRIRVPRLVKLYGQGYSDEQLDNLEPIKLILTCPKELKICVVHWVFRHKRDPEYFESSVDLRQQLSRAGYI